MDLTDEAKAHIDGLSYEELLRRVRFSPAGDEWFQGKTGEYWFKRMEQLRARPGGDEEHVRASKAIGWSPAGRQAPIPPGVRRRPLGSYHSPRPRGGADQGP